MDTLSLARLTLSGISDLERSQRRRKRIGPGRADDRSAAATDVEGNDYEVIADDRVVGRISLFSSSPAGTPWMWSIDFAFHDGRHPAHGFAATCDAAMQAFARSWFREA